MSSHSDVLALTADRCATECIHPEHVAPLLGRIVDANQADALATIFATLGDPTRARLLHALALAEELCVCDLALLIGLSQSAVSHQLRLLRDRRDLGVHSGMLGDGLVELVEAGVVTNARKPIDTGVSITGALIGTHKLYRWAHRNPQIRMCGAAYTHDAAVLAKLERLVTINSAVEVDLTGQVNGEVAGGSYVGAVGGALDFIRAANQSPGGVSLLLVRASRIVAQLQGPVATPRSEAGVVVTECGAADLRGLGLAERRRRMIAIASPENRAALERAT